MKVCSDCGVELSEKIFKSYGVCDPCFEKGVQHGYWDSNKKHMVTDMEIIKLAENEIKFLREQLNDLTDRHEALKEAYDKLVAHKLRKVKI